MSRAADVVLKERRRLVLAVRETPLHTGHLRTMTALSEMGAVIAPIMPAFYNRPQTLDDIINHSVGRMLDLFGIDDRCGEALEKRTRIRPSLTRGPPSPASREKGRGGSQNQLRLAPWLRLPPKT